MAESKIPSFDETLQIIKNLKILPFSEVESSGKKGEFFISDLKLLSALAIKMESLCRDKKTNSISAVFCGLNFNFLVINWKNKNFRYFMEISYEKNGEKTQALEGYVNNTDKNGSIKRYLCERSSKVIIRAKELIIRPQLQIVEIEETIDGVEAILLQNEIDALQYKFINNHGIEMQVI